MAKKGRDYDKMIVIEDFSNAKPMPVDVIVRIVDLVLNSKGKKDNK